MFLEQQNRAATIQQTRHRIGFVKIAVSDSIFMMYVYMNNIDWCDSIEIKKNSHQHDDDIYLNRIIESYIT